MSSVLPAEEFIAAIWQERRRYVREGKIKQPHPWRVALSQGKVSRAAIVEYVKNRYYFLANINRKDAQVIANCPVSDARRMLLKKYIDEEGQDVAGGRLGPHYEMWIKISDALGIDPEVMRSFSAVLPGLSLYRRCRLQLRQTAKLVGRRGGDLRDGRAHVETLYAQAGASRRRANERRRSDGSLLRPAARRVCCFITCTAMPTTNMAISTKRS